MTNDDLLVVLTRLSLDEKLEPREREACGLAVRIFNRAKDAKNMSLRLLAELKNEIGRI